MTHERIAAKRRKILQQHQDYTVNYLMKHRQQRGLLVAHQMGGGKSFIAVAIADAFHGHDVLILGPAHLDFVWTSEMSKYKLANANKARFTFVPYSDHAKLQKLHDLKDTIVIMDEAHHIVSLVGSMPGGAALYRKLQKCYKIILLSGTPIYNDEFDIAYLINLCSGTNTLTLNKAEFIRKYTKVNWKAAAFEGYWRPLVRKVMQGISHAGLYLQLAPSLIDLMLGLSASARGGGDSAFRKQMEHGLASKIAGVAWRGAKYPGHMVKTMGKWLFGIDIPLETLKSSSLFLLQFSFMIVNGINYVIAKVLNSENWQLRELKPTLLHPLLSKYVSFYEREKNADDYARIETLEVTVNYTTEQTKFFLKFCQETLTSDEIAELNNTHDRNSVELFGSQYLAQMQNDIAYGLRIGNLGLPGRNGTVWPYKFDMLWDNCRRGRTKAIIYSSFWREGVLRLQKFLDAKNAKYITLSDKDTPSALASKVEDFNKGKCSILLLHPSMTEGISTTNVRQVHFLEPVVQQAVRDQVIARAVRFKSHTSLPAKDRVVTVFTYIATLDANGLAMHLHKLKEWHKYQREYLPGSVKVKNNYRQLKSPQTQDVLLTPDVIQHQRSTVFGKNVRNLLDSMRHNCIERSGHDNKTTF